MVDIKRSWCRCCRCLGASGTVAAQEETRVTIDPERDFNKEGVALAGAIGFLPGTLLGVLQVLKKQ